ncbi:MAG TPA: NfeD family protein [Gemmatimonadaceae bacterium]|jgi:membrane protein implicated in regulation of membrane protease activity
MNIVYLASFIGGLLLAVRIMITGVERAREDHPSGERTFRLSPPIVAAFALVFGLTGYILSRRAFANVVTDLIIAGVLGLVVALITARLVRDWWKVTPEHETDDERYILQGHPARVTRPIGANVEGEVAFEVGDKRHVLRARGIDDTALAAGAEVIIERIEDEIAYVESWVEVEKRL